MKELTRMAEPKFVPLEGYVQFDDTEMAERAAALFAQMDRRRTVREFSDEPVPRAVIEDCLRVANTAPSGANMQPWHFTVISDPEMKRRVREAAEAEEREFYEHRASDEWLEALAKFGTDANKPFLETAPYLIAIFMQKFAVDDDGNKTKHYYPQESVGLATGMLVAALHQCGLASLTHTPSPMAFLNEICERPKHERAFLLLVVGKPAEDATVPAISRKTLETFTDFR
ncbi:MAG: nitroreductase family protein [Pseudomonadota bacterium]